MIDKIKNLSLKSRLLWLSGLCLAVPLIALTVYQLSAARGVITDQSRQQLQTVVMDVLSMCKLQDELISRKIDTDFAILEEEFDRSGRVIPALGADYAVVDKVQRLTGTMATIFKMVPGGMMRVSTSLRKENNERAVGTLIDAGNPVYQAIAAGKPYRGRAKVLNIWCLAHYEPIVKDGRVIGSLFVGEPQQESSSLRQILAKVKIGKTGYLFAMDSTADILLHPTAEGKSFSQYEFARQMIERKNGWIDYSWEGKRVAYFAYYPPWDWVIVASCPVSDFQSETNRIRLFSWLALLLILPLALLMTHRYVVKYIEGLVETVVLLTGDGAADVVGGKLESRLDIQKTIPEFRPILMGMNMIMDAVISPIKEISNALNRLATDDLTARITKDFYGDYDILKQATNTLASQFAEAIKQISHNTTVLASSAEELSAISAQVNADASQTSSQATAVSAAAEEVSKNVQTVATGTDEMTASIKEIAKNAAEAARVTGEAVHIAEKTNATISKLGDSSLEIGKVIKMITSVAEQTNLLALNATIEAARAGEAGKGFAVVANEVKDLARETAKATEEISQRIEGIQTDTKDAVTAIIQISGVIKRINDIANTIASAVEEQSATTNEIGRNVAEAAKGTGDIARNIGGVAKTAQSTAQATANSQSASSELAKIAIELQRLVGQFKLD